MALVHDMGEALVTDITPLDKVPKQEKSRREEDSMKFLTGRMLEGTCAGPIDKEGKTTGAADNIMALWEEYEKGETNESKFVHDVDKLELVLQMMEYERQAKGKLDLGEFVWVAGRIELPEVKAWALEVLEEREVYWKAKGKGGEVKEWGMTQKLRDALGVRQGVPLDNGTDGK